MNRALQIVGILLLGAGIGVCDQNKPAKGEPPAKAGNPPRPAPRNGGAPRMPPGPRLTNPASPAARLYSATPEQRERVLEKLPPAAQEGMRRNLKWFDSLPREQQQTVLGRTERFYAMPPERQREIRQQFQAFNRLPPDRRIPVRQALNRLQTKSEAERTIILSSDQFKTIFSADEQKIITDLSEVMLPPM